MSRGYRKLGRDTAKRKALLRDLVTDLIINGRIETTLPKAKEVQKLADRMVTLGKINTLSSRIRAAKTIRFEYVDEDKQQYAIQKLFDEIAQLPRSRRGIYSGVKTRSAARRRRPDGDY